jgi:hypothetical protein
MDCFANLSSKVGDALIVQFVPIDPLALNASGVDLAVLPGCHLIRSDKRIAGPPIENDQNVHKTAA